MTEHTPNDRLPLEELAAIVASCGAPESPLEAASAIRHADKLVRRSQERLMELVGSARQSGVAWQAIGDALGVSRQAAFKRFGGGALIDPNERTTMAEQTINLMKSTREVFESLSAGDYEAVRAQMTYSCGRALSKRKVMGAWNEVVSETGALESVTDLTAQTPDGANALSKAANRYLVNGAIVQATLRHEAGDWIGRVAYNGAGKITGLLIAAPGSRGLPF